jgi:dihydrofolate synthase/folylpolyglutamate synthase
LLRLEKLLKKLDNPQNKLPPVIHIAGTNGKGSTLIFIKNIMEEYGLKVHCYTSPHLIRFNERIVLSNKQIHDDDLFNTLNEVIKINNNEEITFFELTTAVALLNFARTKADFCLIETGLGGRLDATNTIKKKILNIITSIGLDHEEFLSPYLNNIVREKCGILSKDIPVIISSQNTNYKSHLLRKKIKDINCKILKLKPIPKNSYLGLVGNHQKINARTAITAVKYVLKDITNDVIQKGLKKTSWPGRIQKLTFKNNLITKSNKILIDGAHNIEGAKIINSHLNKLNSGKWNFIFGMMNNKNPREFIEIIEEHIEKIIFIPIQNQKNSYQPEELKIIFKEKKFDSSVKKNLRSAFDSINPKKPLFITGSLYLMGEVFKLFSVKELDF